MWWLQLGPAQRTSSQMVQAGSHLAPKNAQDRHTPPQKDRAANKDEAKSRKREPKKAHRKKRKHDSGIGKSKVKQKAGCEWKRQARNSEVNGKSSRKKQGTHQGASCPRCPRPRRAAALSGRERETEKLETKCCLRVVGEQETVFAARHPPRELKSVGAGRGEGGGRGWQGPGPVRLRGTIAGSLGQGWGQPQWRLRQDALMLLAKRGEKT